MLDAPACIEWMFHGIALRACFHRTRRVNCAYDDTIFDTRTNTVILAVVLHATELPDRRNCLFEDIRGPTHGARKFG